EVPMGINDKTSLLVVTKHESGALFDLLEPFKDNNINMLQLARHPIPGVKWEYLFFIDIEGHQNNDNVKDAISKIKSKVSKLEILGSYPIAVL
ncbi:prephenate dehydratase, partial [Candidatus Pseudothioglobus singularis]|nr:prephenate dehydratase [Candidatus Pseudothioglobus singularis]